MLSCSYAGDSSWQAAYGQFTLWGITSVGGNSENACSGIGSRSKPGIYTKVVNYMDWIAMQFKKNHVDPNA